MPALPHLQATHTPVPSLVRAKCELYVIYIQPLVARARYATSTPNGDPARAGGPARATLYSKAGDVYRSVGSARFRYFVCVFCTIHGP